MKKLIIEFENDQEYDEAVESIASGYGYEREVTRSEDKKSKEEFFHETIERLIFKAVIDGQRPSIVSKAVNRMEKRVNKFKIKIK